MMKPKGRTEQEVGMLEFLEDIIGTSRLKEPIAELNQRVEELRSVRDEKVRTSTMSLLKGTGDNTGSVRALEGFEKPSV